MLTDSKKGFEKKRYLGSVVVCREKGKAEGLLKLAELRWQAFWNPHGCPFSLLSHVYLLDFKAALKALFKGNVGVLFYV